MSDYIAFKDQALLDSGDPATHAIVIGVGRYPYLNGGDPGKLTTENGGLKQLSSPPESAREFTTWLLDEFNNPDRPLATVSMLIAEEGPEQAYTHARLDQPFTPKAATIAHVAKAVDEWKTLGDRSEENMTLFFFCGHGVAGGLINMTLLLSDYGALNSNPMDGAVDFSALYRGMSQCKASYQCFFVDACRTVTDIATDTTAKGRVLIQDKTDRPWPSGWNNAIFYSTLAGEKAYGRKNQPSFYTEELIRGLNGTGSNNRNGPGDWRIETGDLGTALNRGLLLRGKKIQTPAVDISFFEFHELRNEPIVPIVVYCNPESDTDLAKFTCLQNGNQMFSRDPEPDKWVKEIPHGTYDFRAEAGARAGDKKDRMILPPGRDIEIEMKATP